MEYFYKKTKSLKQLNLQYTETLQDKVALNSADLPYSLHLEVVNKPKTGPAVWFFIFGEAWLIYYNITMGLS